MLTRQLLELQLLLLILLGTWASVLAQPSKNNNRVVLELPTINFTRLYNGAPLVRLYSRLFNSTKEKTEEAPLEEIPSQRQGFRNPFRIFKSTTETQRSDSNQVINVQVPNGQSGQQLVGGLGYGFAQGQGQSAGYGYGYGLPDYARIYGSNNFNSIPGVQVLQQPSNGFGFGAPNYFNYVNLNNDRIRSGYGIRGYNLFNSEFNDGRGQLYADFEPYRQWLQAQALQLNAQQQFAEEQAYDESLDYGEGDEQDFEQGLDGLALDNGEQDDYDVDGTDYGDAEGGELWRQADAGKKTEAKPLKATKPGQKLKARRQKKRHPKQIIY